MLKNKQSEIKDFFIVQLGRQIKHADRVWYLQPQQPSTLSDEKALELESCIATLLLVPKLKNLVIKVNVAKHPKDHQCNIQFQDKSEVLLIITNITILMNISCHGQ